MESKLFEIHITGSKNIINYLEKNNINFLEIKMLDKENKIISTDYMSHIKYRCNSIDEARQYASELGLSILPQNNIEVYRIKIESPFEEEYIENASYIETHIATDISNKQLPLSYVVNKNRYIATDRCYDKKLFADFHNKYEKTELCILDTNCNHDLSWFKKYYN